VYLQSINQSKVLTKPHTGKGEATSQHLHRGQQTLHHEVMQAWEAVDLGGCGRVTTALVCTFMLNTRGEDSNTVFYSDLAGFMNAVSLNMYASMSYTGLTRRNTLFVFLWLHPRNT